VVGVPGVWAVAAAVRPINIKKAMRVRMCVSPVKTRRTKAPYTPFRSPAEGELWAGAETWAIRGEDGKTWRAGKGLRRSGRKDIFSHGSNTDETRIKSKTNTDEYRIGTVKPSRVDPVFNRLGF